MRNPDPWLPEEPKKPQLPPSRRGAVVGLVVVVLLIVAGLLLSYVLRQMAKQQDCALAGRADCTSELDGANSRP